MTRTFRTLIAGCAAAPLLAGAALAEPVTADLVAGLLNAQVVAGSAMPTGQHLQFSGFRATGSVYQVEADALIVPGQRDGQLAFLLENATITQIEGEGGGMSAASLQGSDLSVLRAILDDTFQGTDCDSTASEVLIEGEDVNFWADGDLSTGGPANRETTRMAYVQATMVQGEACSEIVGVTATQFSTSTPTGGTATLAELTYAARPGADSAVGLSASGFALKARTGMEVLAVDNLALQASFTRPFHEVFGPDQDPIATLVQEMRSGMMDISLTGLSSRLDLLVPGGRAAGIVIPPGHSLNGDLKFGFNGTGDGVAITGVSAMEGLVDMKVQATMSLPAEASDPMAMLAQMQIGAATLSLKDRGLDALLEASKGYDTAELARRGMAKGAALAPGGTGQALTGLTEDIASWIETAMRRGGTVSMDPQPPVTAFEIGMLAISAPAWLSGRLGLETGTVGN